MARAAGGEFLLRIEDIDQTRARPEWEDLICEDLAWLGITWDGPVLRQSGRMIHYAAALDALWARGLLYPCTCTRRDIADALSAPQEGGSFLFGPDGPVYPGTCRPTSPPADPLPPRPADQHLRLDMAKALATVDPGDLALTETGPDHAGRITPPRDSYLLQIGDVVLARRDFGTSYHLSVVLDDAAQGISHVVRGADLFDATPIHVLLQRLLGLPVPVYHHHRLIRDAGGKRLAKRDDACALRKFREDGLRPEDIRAMVGLPNAA